MNYHIGTQHLPTRHLKVTDKYEQCIAQYPVLFYAVHSYSIIERWGPHSLTPDTGCDPITNHCIGGKLDRRDVPLAKRIFPYQSHHVDPNTDRDVPLAKHVFPYQSQPVDPNTVRFVPLAKQVFPYQSQPVDPNTDRDVPLAKHVLPYQSHPVDPNKIVMYR